MSQPDRPQPATQPAQQQQAATQPPTLDSTQILGGRTQVAINHGGELYSLRVTRNGKLILTK
ncbi:hemin uptake protein HemP [Methyloversatilis sp.]|uniref:hemin uptake protein HemP n=1 Tax=Methyloversatilis sp. TaxID=2569862 RepID=UPI0035AF79D1